MPVSTPSSSSRRARARLSARPSARSLSENDGGGMIRSLYRGATWLAAPLLRRHLVRRVPQGKEEAERIGERYGKASLARPAGRLGWLHGASVGETQSLRPLTAALTARQPDLTLLVPTGPVTSAPLLAQRP